MVEFPRQADIFDVLQGCLHEIRKAAVVHYAKVQTVQRHMGSGLVERTVHLGGLRRKQMNRVMILRKTYFWMFDI